MSHVAFGSHVCSYPRSKFAARFERSPRSHQVTRRPPGMLPEDPEAFRRIGSSASSTSAAENISNATDLERLSAALDPVNGWDYEPEQTVAMRCARAHVGEGPYRLDQVRVCARSLSRPEPLGYSPGATRWCLAASTGHPLRGCHQ